MLFRYKCIFKTFKRSVVWTGAKSVEIPCENNAALKIESGRLARFADGSATAKLGDTVVLATVVSKETKKNASFLPLTVDYRQRSTAAGLIPTTWNRREGGVVDREVLVARLIDRSVRPLFPLHTFCNDTQLICTTHSIDTLHNPVVIAINAASAALALSDIPWSGPVGAVQVGLRGSDEIIINPTNKQLQASQLNLLITVSHDGKIVMMDGCGDQVAPDVLRGAVLRGVQEAARVVEAIKELQAQLGKKKRGGGGAAGGDSADSQDVASSSGQGGGSSSSGGGQGGASSSGIGDASSSSGGGIPFHPSTKTLEDEVSWHLSEMCEDKIRAVFSDHSHDKFSRDLAVRRIKEEAMVEFKSRCRKDGVDEKNVSEDAGDEVDKYDEKVTKDAKDGIPPQMIDEQFNKLAKSIFRALTLETGVRCDGRRVDELRKISCSVDNYSILHGSSLFQRGQTQVMCSTTFGSAQSEVRLDAVSAIVAGESRKDFFLHYEFPPYGTNEIGRSGLVGRRELGHGALAEKALKTVVPGDHPFTILLSAEVLESNGSSSMATVCAGSLALMDAGVAINALVSGVAMGLVTKQACLGETPFDETGSYVILTDLMGIEDYMGDMDFKIASTLHGVTALQMDTKLPGLPTKIVFESIEKALEANRKIIEIMRVVAGEARSSPKPSHPVVEEVKVSLTKRSKFLGVGGSNLRKILSETGVQITAVDDETYQVFAPNGQAMGEARSMMQRILSEQSEPILDFGAIYNVRIDELKDTGAMVVLHASMPAIFIPNNQLDSRKVSHPSSLGLLEGQELKVKYFGRDPVSGKIRLSRKVLQVLAADIKNHL